MRRTIRKDDALQPRTGRGQQSGDYKARRLSYVPCMKRDPLGERIHTKMSGGNGPCVNREIARFLCFSFSFGGFEGIKRRGFEEVGPINWV